MNHIRLYAGDIVFGLVAGTTAAVLGRGVLRGIPLWMVGVLVVLAVVAVELSVSAVRRRRAGSRPRRRAHARPAASRPLAASANQTEGEA